MAQNCLACEDLKEYAPEFVVNGVTEAVCNSLVKNNGLNPNLSVLHNNCSDLQDVNDCLIGALGDTLPAYDICDIKDYLEKLTKNIKLMFDALICNECGQWTLLDGLVDAEGYITVSKIHTYVVPVEKFILLAPELSRQVWFSGAPNVGESYISIPVQEMDLVTSVQAQPRVVGDMTHAVTVAIQEEYLDETGENYIINFDTYEIQGVDIHIPFAVPIDFIVTGKKKVNWPV